jgi:hypothetical protein
MADAIAGALHVLLSAELYTRDAYLAAEIKASATHIREEMRSGRTDRREGLRQLDALLQYLRDAGAAD